MRFLILSLGAAAWIAGPAPAPTPTTPPPADGGGSLQLPVGQTFKQFEVPVYQAGVLKATVSAVEATGITLNRAETKTLCIYVYDQGVKTTTITSPDADLYVAEQKMRTKNTVKIERSDMEATSQDCYYDLTNKKYLLRTNVKVTLKHFDISQGAPGSAPAPGKTATTAAPATGTAPLPATAPRPADDGASMLDSPGGYSSTNSAGTPALDTK